MRCNHCGSEWNVSPGLSMSITNCPFCGKPLLPEKKKLETIEDVLVAINNQFGISVLTDGTKLLAYFSDMAPQLSRQRRILGYFVECDGPKKIFSALNSSDDEQSVCIKQIVQEMKAEMYIEENASQMICSAFLYALSGTRILKTVTGTVQTEQKELPQLYFGLKRITADQFDQVRYYIEAGKKLNAIKLIQKLTGLSLTDAKEITDNFNVINFYSPQSYISDVKMLVLKHKINSKYLVKDTIEFNKKIGKAINAYAKQASNETGLLMWDSTILGSAKEGFVLTNKTLYYNGGYFSEKGACTVENIADVFSSSTSNGLQYINLKLNETISGKRGQVIHITYTSDMQEADRIVCFWKELLHLQ